MKDGQDLRRLTLILFAAARLFNYFFRLPALDYLSALLILLILLQAEAGQDHPAGGRGPLFGGRGFAGLGRRAIRGLAGGPPKKRRYDRPVHLRAHDLPAFFL